MFARVGFIATTTVTWHWASSRQKHCSLRLWCFALTLHASPPTCRSLSGFSVRSEIEDEEKVYASNVMVGQMEGLLRHSFLGRGSMFVFFFSRGNDSLGEWVVIVL